MGVLIEVPQMCERCGDTVLRRQWVMDDDWVVLEYACMCRVHHLTLVRNVRTH